MTQVPREDRNSRLQHTSVWNLDDEFVIFFYLHKDHLFFLDTDFIRRATFFGTELLVAM